MLMTDLIAKKRDGGELSAEEIQFMVDGYVRGDIADYQMSAMCMAILFRGMTDRETLDLTMAMMHSGEVVDLSGIDGIKADKHSTGGVGDKTSLILCPMVAACGLRIAKMSGRGLGHTGGTLDKLESFPGYNISIGEKRFIENVNRIGIALIGQTADIVPADKKLYALRDVTGTVPSIPLIVSSIMSKKLASGADVIVLDVKCGSGAFMKTEEQARELARGLTRIGRLAGKKCAAVITDMDQPLGCAVGNALEIKEAISVLRGETRGDLLELCLTLGSCILTEAGVAEDTDTARRMLQGTIDSGAALKKLAELVEAQDGEAHDVYDTARLSLAPELLEVPSDTSGYLSHIECEKVGLISMHLGGGRATKESAIDLSVGLVLNKKVGDHVEKGETGGDLLELCLTLGSCMLTEVGYAPNIDAARKMLMEALRSGAALEKLAQMVAAQGGAKVDVYDPVRLPTAPVQLEVPSEQAGFVRHIEAEQVGLVSMHLGGGRATKEDSIDLSVGLVLHKKVGDRVEKGESLAVIHAPSEAKAEEAARLLRACYAFSDAPVERPAFIKAIIH